MQLGIGTYTYPWSIGVPGFAPAQPLGPFELLDKAAELGVRLVQVADNLPLDQLSSTELEAFARHAHEQNISVEVGTRGIAPDHLRAYLHLAGRLGSPILRVVVDTVGHQPSVEEVIRTLHTIIPEFAQAGICLAIENHDRFKSIDLAGIVEQVGSQFLGICLDTVNSFGALEGPEFVVETLGPWVVNLHLKDFAILRASHLMGFTVEGRPAGQGQLNIPWLLQRLHDLGRSPNAFLELWPPPEETLAETIAKENAWSVSSIRYLRQLIPA